MNRIIFYFFHAEVSEHEYTFFLLPREAACPAPAAALSRGSAVSPGAVQDALSHVHPPALLCGLSCGWNRVTWSCLCPCPARLFPPPAFRSRAAVTPLHLFYSGSRLGGSRPKALVMLRAVTHPLPPSRVESPPVVLSCGCLNLWSFASLAGVRV